MRVRLEHLGFNVIDADAAAQWYIDNLDFVMVRHANDPTHNQFIADPGRHFMIQFYTRNEPRWESPSNVFTQQLALLVDQIEAMRVHLIQCGATEDGPIMTNVYGDQVCFLRDPFGVVLELVQRVVPMLPLD